VGREVLKTADLSWLISVGLSWFIGFV
ncbi:uncharacterized protein METZ01_LOCUS274192, partial [marine metagenome]